MKALMEDQKFTEDDLEIAELPEREAMGSIRVLSGNNNLSPRGRNSSLVGIILDLF
ncbi:MAG TPA: hypothetical protein VG034_26020 [Acidimicrobiia bacterium]|nr:hypothetical protein [Acidimicrobiia bacterium]